MGSTFFGLDIAYTGLLASNAGLNTTGNNIANVETEGYSRQEVDQVAANALRTYTTYGAAGAGVQTLSIERIRDEYYDHKYWNNQSNYGEYEAKSYYMAQIESYYSDGEQLAGFTSVFNDMYEAMEELKKNAGDTTTRSQFVGSAGELTSYFNSMYESIQKMQTDINDEIKVKVDEINSLAAKIASINNQVNVIEVNGGTANELRDERALLVDQLSKIIDVEASETPIVDANNPTRETGANRYLIKIGGGQNLVDGSYYNTLDCIARSSSEKVNQSDVDGLYDIYWTDENGNVDINTATKLNVYANNITGEIKGLIELRDGNNTEYFHGTTTAVGTTTDGTGRRTATVEVTEEYLTDINKNNMSDSGGIINLGNQLYQYDSWSMSYDSVSDTYSYEFILSTSNTNVISGSRVGKEASIGQSISYQGIPYYMGQMNEWARIYTKAFNDIMTSGVDNNGDPAENFFVADNVTTGGEFMFTVDPTTGYDVSDDTYYKITAGTISISDAIEANSNLMATHTSASEGQDAYDILDDLLDMKNDKTVAAFRGASVSEFLQGILSDVSLNASNANLFNESYSNLEGSIDIQRQSISGVDNDEEGINLVKYQNSYNLAAKMIQTLTEVYDRLILQTGV